MPLIVEEFKASFTLCSCFALLPHPRNADVATSTKTTGNHQGDLRSLPNKHGQENGHASTRCQVHARPGIGGGGNRAEQRRRRGQRDNRCGRERRKRKGGCGGQSRGRSVGLGRSFNTGAVEGDCFTVGRVISVPVTLAGTLTPTLVRERTMKTKVGRLSCQYGYNIAGVWCLQREDEEMILRCR